MKLLSAKIKHLESNAAVTLGELSKLQQANIVLQKANKELKASERQANYDRECLTHSVRFACVFYGIPLCNYLSADGAVQEATQSGG
jgi:hypothetical protein